MKKVNFVSFVIEKKSGEDVVVGLGVIHLPLNLLKPAKSGGSK